MSQKHDAIFHLRKLVTAMDKAFISSWQSTEGWEKELSAARDYLEGKHEDLQNSCLWDVYSNNCYISECGIKWEITKKLKTCPNCRKTIHYERALI